jgi:hypothetical protein
MIKNPFSVISPEDMTANEAHQLFVELASENSQIRRPGNNIIKGARGCGKSMLIRCSMPDVLMVRDENQLTDLEYLAFCVPVKRTCLNLTDLRALDDKHAPYIINEHFMVVHVIMHTMLSLSELDYGTSYSEQAYKTFFDKTYKYYLSLCGCNDVIDVDYTSAKTFFQSLYQHTELLQSEFIQYATNLVLNVKGVDYSYNLPLLSFLRFVVPVFKKLTSLPGFPKGKNIYLFIDDADNLSEIQTEILNSWLACRTQPTISLKVSTQIGQYKTFLTSTGILVESPHDYQDINISYRYTTDTSDSSNYYKRAVEILKKRLEIANIDITPEAFFPTYKKQEEGIKAEETRIRNEYENNKRGYAVYDDVRRYAIPEYIKSLGGSSKSRMTYRYAGLDNMIHLSSGIIRYLLDAAAAMYDKQNEQLVPQQLSSAKKGKNPVCVTFIDTQIQNDVLRTQADNFLFTELRKSAKQEADGRVELETTSSPTSVVEKLQNLINAMGKTFHEILLSDRSERKVFSIALTNKPDDEIKSVLNLGVRLGFLHESRIGNKQGNGKTWLYVLNRCFAPLFTLDPTGFQGYLFMRNDDLKRAMNTGKQLRNIALSEDDTTLEGDLRQLSLNDIWED